MEGGELTLLGGGAVVGLAGAAALWVSGRAGRLRGREQWGGLDALFALVVLVWSSSAASALLIRALTGVWEPAHEADLLGPAALGTAAGGLLSMGCALLRAEPAALGFVAPRARWIWWLVPVMTLLFFGVSALWGLVLEQRGVAPEQALSVYLREEWPSPETAGLIVYGVMIAPIVEEVLFRGFLLPPLVRGLGAAGGILASAVLFGGMHMADPQAVPPLIVLGIALAWLRVHSGSLGPPLALHALNNLTAISLVLLQASAQ